MVIYRAFFHRIRHFPGPFWAGVSRFYAFGLAAKNLQYNVELQKLHEEYGDFIRTGMLQFTYPARNTTNPPPPSLYPVEPSNNFHIPTH